MIKFFTKVYNLEPKNKDDSFYFFDIISTTIDLGYN